MVLHKTKFLLGLLVQQIFLMVAPEISRYNLFPMVKGWPIFSFLSQFDFFPGVPGNSL